MDEELKRRYVAMQKKVRQAETERQEIIRRGNRTVQSLEASPRDYVTLDPHEMTFVISDFPSQ